MLDLYVDRIVSMDQREIAPVENEIIEIYNKAINSGLPEDIAKRTVANQLALRIKTQEDTFVGLITTRIIDQVSTVRETEPTTKLQVIDFYQRTASALQERIISGKNLVQSNFANIGTYLTAYQDIGNIRDNQEDSALICESSDKKMQFLAVCDGVGGTRSSEEASDYAVKELREWFRAISNEPNLKELDYRTIESLRETIVRIGNEIFEKYNGNAATTLVCAIVKDGRALIANVGDSRAYIMKGKEIKQVTTDDSFGHQEYLINGWDKEFPEENMRFYNQSNVIMKALGASRSKASARPTFTTIGRDEYDRIVLCSDGVSDCLGTKDMVAVSRICPRDQFAAKLVKAALKHVSHLPRKMKKFNEQMPIFQERIEPGKDNTTAVVFDKKAKEEER
jgi:protein phosphatase